MSDDEDAPMREKDPKQNELSSTSDDDDSSSSSSGSSSSSDSSDSESDGEGQQGERRGDDAHADDDASSRKYSIESVASSNGRARGDRGEPLADVNSNRAAARFREQNSEVGLMALGTKKRDRRTIEEIQRDLQKKRGRSGMGMSSNGAGSSSSKPPMAATARASPPKGSPALSPEPAGSDSSQIAAGLPQIKMPKGKPNSARSRLTMKILGRGRPNPVPAPKSAIPKKPSAGAAASSASSAGSGPGIGSTGSGGIVTNISASAKVAKSSSSSNDLGACKLASDVWCDLLSDDVVMLAALFSLLVVCLQTRTSPIRNHQSRHGSSSRRSSQRSSSGSLTGRLCEPFYAACSASGT